MRSTPKKLAKTNALFAKIDAFTIKKRDSRFLNQPSLERQQKLFSVTAPSV